MSGPRWLWRRRLTLMLIGAVLAVFALELGARLWPGLPPGVSAAVSLHDLRFLTRVDHRFGYVLQPGFVRHAVATSDLQIFHITTHPAPWMDDVALGFRDDFAPLPGRPVVLVGDSFAMGWGVDDQDSLAALIEGGLGVPCHNLAVAGYGPQQALEVLEQIGAASHASCAVWVFYANDIEDSGLFAWWSEDRTRTWPSATPKSAFARAINRYSAAYKLFRFIDRHYSADRFHWRDGEREHLFAPYWRNVLDLRQDWVRAKCAIVQQQIDRFAELAAKHSFVPLFVAAPYREQVYREEYDTLDPLPAPAEARDAYEQVVAHARARGLTVLDTLPLLRAHKGRTLYLYEDPHWSIEGNRVVAGALTELLRALR